MTQAVEKIKNKVLKYGKPIRIVFPEGWNKNIQEAAIMLKDTNVVPVLVFKKESEITSQVKDFEKVVIEKYDLETMAKQLVELRKAKGLSIDDARKLVRLPNYFATMLIKNKFVDGYVGGIEMTTKDTVLPALQIVKTEPNARLVSSVMIMEKDNEVSAWGDCAINANPTAEELKEIAKSIAFFAKNVLEIPQINLAMLSYSTVGSGTGKDVDKVTEAINLLKADSSFVGKVDHEYQFDAAFVPAVRTKKAPNSILNSSLPANVYVFPNLDSGNIGYKIAQRVGGMTATGPALIGLAAPINDLSRGASTLDVVGVTFLTAAQAIAMKQKH